MSRGDAHLHRMLRTAEWSISKYNDQFVEEFPSLRLLPFDDGDAGFTAGDDQELTIVEEARRRSEMLTPRSVATVCLKLDEVPAEVVASLRGDLDSLVSQHLGSSAVVHVGSKEEGEGVAFLVEYDAPDESNEGLLDSLSALRKGFVSIVPEAYWGKVALLTRAK